MTDEYQFNPYRTKVPVGTTVTWRNNGTMVHSPVAEDGSWSTGPIDPAGVAAVTFDRPGTYVYICKEHLWAYAQIDPAVRFRPRQVRVVCADSATP